MSRKAVERVQNLIKLATVTTNVEEARSAALEACRAIARYGLVVAEKTSQVAQDAASEVRREVENAVRDAAPSPENAEKFKRAVSRGVGKAAEHLVEDAISSMFGGKKR